MFPHKAGKLGWFITNIVVPKVQTLFLCDIQFIWMQPQNCENNISLKQGWQNLAFFKSRETARLYCEVSRDLRDLRDHEN